VLKHNIHKNRQMHWSIVIDLTLITACAYGIYYTVDNLVESVSTTYNPNFSLVKIGWVIILAGLVLLVPTLMLIIRFIRKPT